MKEAGVYERDEGLPASTHRIELVGSPRELIWPPICPNCGGQADQRVTVRKVFRRMAPTDDGFKRMWQYRVQSLDVPLCRPCADAHRAAAPDLSPLQVLLSCLRTGVMFAFVPALVATIAAAWLLLGSIGTSAFRAYALVLAACATATIAAAIAAWRETRFRRVPPLTDIVRACDVSDNLGDVLSGERHAYAIRNSRFAEAFVNADADRVFDASRRARAQSVQRAKHALGWFLLLICGLGTFWLWLTGQL
jgi:hypothetical protein